MSLPDENWGVHKWLPRDAGQQVAFQRAMHGLLALYEHHTEGDGSLRALVRGVESGDATAYQDALASVRDVLAELAARVHPECEQPRTAGCASCQSLAIAVRCGSAIHIWAVFGVPDMLFSAYDVEAYMHHVFLSDRSVERHHATPRGSTTED